MSHYAKLAAVGVRVAATFVFLLGLTGFTYTLISAILGIESRGELPRYFVASIFYLFAGAIVFLLGKTIGRFVARGIE